MLKQLIQIKYSIQKNIKKQLKQHYKIDQTNKITLPINPPSLKHPLKSHKLNKIHQLILNKNNNNNNSSSSSILKQLKQQ